MTSSLVPSAPVAHDRMGISYWYNGISDDLKALVPAIGVQDVHLLQPGDHPMVSRDGRFAGDPTHNALVPVSCSVWKPSFRRQAVCENE